ncbi:MAG: VanZ family protein [Thermoleophilia bacterium]|nr:VanZ family protein [Thermoleophilia bacterium]
MPARSREQRREAELLINGSVMWLVGAAVAVAIVVFQLRARTGLWHTLGVVFLACYACWIASQAFFPLPAWEGFGFSIGRVNLIPLRHFVDSFHHLSAGQIIRQHGGNFLLLVPFTLVGPALWPRLRAWKWALAVGVGGSLTIELVQLVLCVAVDDNYRTVDIDDVIVNTAGALVGYALSLGIRARLRTRAAVS